MAFGNATKGYVKKHSGGGGGGGTSNYSELSNKPQINGVTLDGNKTSEDLGVNTTQTLLYSGNSLEQSIQLSESWSDYDALYILAEDDTSGDVFIISSLYLTDDIDTDYRIGASTDAGYIWYSITNRTTFSFTGGSTGYYIKAIRGIKF